MEPVILHYAEASTISAPAELCSVERIILWQCLASQIMRSTEHSGLLILCDGARDGFQATLVSTLDF